MSSILHKKSPRQLGRAQLVEQLKFLGQMQSTETAHFHQMAAAKNGMNVTDSKTITVLMQEGSQTAGQLASRLSLTTGAVTNLIDRLEAAGYVHRVSDPDDRRKVIVQLNSKKLAGMEKTYDSMSDAFERILARYSTDQLEFLTAFFKAAIELSREQTRKL